MGVMSIACTATMGQKSYSKINEWILTYPSDDNPVVRGLAQNISQTSGKSIIIYKLSAATYISTKLRLLIKTTGIKDH